MKLIFGSLVASVATAYPLPPISGYQFVEPEKFNILRSSGQSSLHEIVLPEDSEYVSGKVLIANLTGDREEIGRAYAELLGEEVMDTYELFTTSLFGANPAMKEFINLFADWLWNRHYSFYVPDGYLAELRGMRKASPKGKGVTVDQVSTRFNALSNMPADPQNIISALEFELEKGLPEWEASLLNRFINHFTHCTWCLKDSEGRLRVPFSPGCDSFGIWGSRTETGKLFTSRNLDWTKDSGISKHKLVVITNTPGAHTYATFGFTLGFGALAGMSERGITVSEMNLDNSQTTFSGPPFPLRLRMILEQADDLESAKALWQATNSTDSMNFMIGSSKDGKSMAIEAMRGYSAFYLDNNPVEAAATCAVVESKDKLAGACGSVFPEVDAHAGKKRIGSPIVDAVWRSNHAVDPQHMLSQEPLSNDTAFRYTFLRDLIQDYEKDGQLIGAAQAVSIAAALGIKGPDYLSCDPAQFELGSNILSAVYEPAAGAGNAYVAWEDGTKETWKPAACTTYLRLDFSQWWGGHALELV